MSKIDRDAMDDERSMMDEESKLARDERWDMRGEAVSRCVERSP